MQTILLATDLDKTLLGNKKSLSKLNKLLAKLRANNGLKLVYVTARSIESYNELALNESLLIPDALITSVGTEIYTDLKSQKMPGWPSVEEWDIVLANRQLTTLSGLTKQPISEQRNYKVSYYLDTDHPPASQKKSYLEISTRSYIRA